jgi:hypothetical protein
MSLLFCFLILVFRQNNAAFPSLYFFEDYVFIFISSTNLFFRLFTAIFCCFLNTFASTRYIFLLFRNISTTKRNIFVWDLLFNSWELYYCCTVEPLSIIIPPFLLQVHSFFLLALYSAHTVIGYSLSKKPILFDGFIILICIFGNFQNVNLESPNYPYFYYFLSDIVVLVYDQKERPYISSKDPPSKVAKFLLLYRKIYFF